MLDIVISAVTDPVIALFVSVCLGHLIGRLRIGPVSLGGVCGTLFVALAIGQLGVSIDPDLKNTAFALFIYALGFSAGPQFFANIRGNWRFGVFSIIEAGSVLALVAVATVVFGFDAGTSAGLFAGAATESAVVGTASDALAGLSLGDAETLRLQANIATAYSLTYLFGLVAIVFFTTQIAPAMMRINLRESAADLADRLGAGDDEAVGANGLPLFSGRAFRSGAAAGKSVAAYEASRRHAVFIARIVRDEDVFEPAANTVIEPRDILLLHGRRDAVISAARTVGEEVPVPADISIPLARKEVVLNRKDAFGISIAALKRSAPHELQRGLFIEAVRRMGHAVPAFPNTKLQQGDVLVLYGVETAVNGAVETLGLPVPDTDVTDFVYLGLGIVSGLLLGRMSIDLAGAPVTLGAGGGALVAGLFFGWLNMRSPARAQVPVAAANFMKDFGLATFIAAIGLGAGPDAVTLVKEYGLILPVLGMLVSVVPAFISLLVGWKLMKIEPPILLGVIAGQHCSTPTISALVSQAGNATPVIGYTVTYAISNVLLPLLGPVTVAMASSLH